MGCELAVGSSDFDAVAAVVDHRDVTELPSIDQFDLMARCGQIGAEPLVGLAKALVAERFDPFASLVNIALPKLTERLAALAVHMVPTVDPLKVRTDEPCAHARLGADDELKLSSGGCAGLLRGNTGGFDDLQIPLDSRLGDPQVACDHLTGHADTCQTINLMDVVDIHNDGLLCKLKGWFGPLKTRG